MAFPNVGNSRNQFRITIVPSYLYAAVVSIFFDLVVAHFPPELVGWEFPDIVVFVTHIGSVANH